MVKTKQIVFIKSFLVILTEMANLKPRSQSQRRFVSTAEKVCANLTQLHHFCQQE